MLVVLEGPEAVGKTTFAKTLEHFWDGEYKYVHRPRSANTPNRIGLDLKDAKDNPDCLIVWDRCYPSDLVYRTWDGGHSAFTVNACEMEETVGKAIDELGHRYLLTDYPQVLEARRYKRKDPDDVQIPPDLEMRLYETICSPNWLRLPYIYRTLATWDKLAKGVETNDRTLLHLRRTLLHG